MVRFAITLAAVLFASAATASAQTYPAKPIRLIILKARREGISTAIESWLMSMIAEGDYVNALITAHMKRPAG